MKRYGSETVAVGVRVRTHSDCGVEGASGKGTQGHCSVGGLREARFWDVGGDILSPFSLTKLRISNTHWPLASATPSLMIQV